MYSQSLIAPKKQQEGNKMEGEISLFASQYSTANVLFQALWKQDSSVTEWEVCPIHAVPSNSTEHVLFRVNALPRHKISLHSVSQQ